ncbi:MAG: hypothetical protein ACRBB6_04265 [Neptuniibacter sp.]
MSWITKLKEYAPDIAAAIATGGATLPQLALKAISDATGKPIDSEDSLSQIITQADPDVMLKIKQANNNFKIRMRELDVEMETAELKNQEHAREQHKHSPMPAVITFMLTIIVAGLFGSLFVYNIPAGNKDTLYILIGQASALWAASVTYWVGTTRSSAEKTRKFKIS